MKELKRQLKIYPTLNTTMLVGNWITEQDIDDLCEAYGLIRCNFTKGFDHYIGFTKNDVRVTDFNQLF